LGEICIYRGVFFFIFSFFFFSDLKSTFTSSILPVFYLWHIPFCFLEEVLSPNPNEVRLFFPSPSTFFSSLPTPIRIFPSFFQPNLSFSSFCFDFCPPRRTHPAPISHTRPSNPMSLIFVTNWGDMLIRKLPSSKNPFSFFHSFL